MDACDAEIAAWTEVGELLMALNPRRFKHLLKQVTIIVEQQRTLAGFFLDRRTPERTLARMGFKRARAAA